MTTPQLDEIRRTKYQQLVFHNSELLRTAIKSKSTTITSLEGARFRVTSKDLIFTLQRSKRDSDQLSFFQVYNKGNLILYLDDDARPLGPRGFVGTDGLYDIVNNGYNAGRHP